MRTTLITLSILILTSCSSKTDLDELLLFDTSIRNQENIFQLGRHRVNNVLFSNHLESNTISIELSNRLNEFGLTEEIYNSLKNGINKVNQDIYIRMDNCSIYITGGSFAGRYGLLVDHGSKNREGEKFTANGRYPINVGKEIEKNIYSIWTD